MSWTMVLEHLFIVFASSFLSILVGLPLGIAAYRLPKLRGIILRIADLFQTIPSLALLGIIMVFAGAGKLTVIIGITLYSLLPIVRNTCLGLREVDGGVKEAARGMGMSPLYQQFAVELPLAMPTIFTGIRIAVINAIGSAVFAAFVGGGGLGGLITRSIRIHDITMLLTGTVVLMVIAAVLDSLMGVFETQLRKKHGKKRRFIAPAAIALAVFIALIPFGLSEARSESALYLYDGDYSETQLMNRMVKLLVEENTDVTVHIQDQMSQVNSFKSLIGGRHTCDLMISYDGTLLTTFLGLDTSDVPDGVSIYDYANEVAGEKHELRLLQKLGFDNTYAIAVPQSVAEAYSLSTVTDLVPVANDLIFGAEHEFFTQEGSMKYGPFTEFYGLEFADTVAVDVSLKYSAVERGSFDVTEVYATDGLNRKANLKVLEDDLSFFPDYNGAFLVRYDTLERFPELEEILDRLAGMISNEDMVEMTYNVDVLGEGLDDVARDYLLSLNLISK